MEYVNPVSIAQMANVPKDTSLPGTGYGLMQGFNEGEALNRSKDFLNMAQASQAQQYAQNQFKMQTDWENYPLEKLAKQQNLDKGQQELTRSKYDLGALQEKAKKDKVFEHMRLAGGAADAFRNAKTDLEKRAVYEQMRKAHEMSGIPVDDDLHFDVGNADSTARVQHYLDTARDIVAYSPDTLGAIAANDPKIKAGMSEGAADRASRERINREDNDVRLKIANITAGVHLATQQGSAALNAKKAELLAAWPIILAKNPKDWTAEDRAINTVNSQMFAGAYSTARDFTQNAGVRGEVKEAETSGEMSGIRQGLGGGEPTVKPQPNKPAVEGTSLEDRLNRYTPK